MDNGRRPAFDVSALIEPIPIKAGDYEFALPADMSLPMLTDIQRELQVVSRALQEPGIDVTGAEEKLWAVFEELLSRATPPPPRPVREMFTTSAMTSIYGFLLTEWGEKRKSITSSPSPTPSAAPSGSPNSSAASHSIEAPAGS